MNLCSKFDFFIKFFFFHPQSVIIDTSWKLLALKHGYYNNKFVQIKVTSAAHPDVLSLPQEFASAAQLNSISFVYYPDGEFGQDEITIYPNRPSRASIKFSTIGEHSLHGVPKHYEEYTIRYCSASTPTADDIVTILQWKSAMILSFFDRGGMALILFQRAKELATLPVLNALELSINDENYDKINVATFIENIPTLRYIQINGYRNTLSQQQIREFVVMNPLTVEWSVRVQGNYISYKKLWITPHENRWLKKSSFLGWVFGYRGLYLAKSD